MRIVGLFGPKFVLDRAVWFVYIYVVFFFFFQAEDGIRDLTVTGVQTCALPILIDGEMPGRAPPRIPHATPAKAAGMMASVTTTRLPVARCRAPARRAARETSRPPRRSAPPAGSAARPGNRWLRRSMPQWRRRSQATARARRRARR